MIQGSWNKSHFSRNPHEGANYVAANGVVANGAKPRCKKTNDNLTKHKSPTHPGHKERDTSNRVPLIKSSVDMTACLR